MLSALLLLLLLCGRATADVFVDVPHFIEVLEDTAKKLHPSIEIHVEEEIAGDEAVFRIECTAGHVSLPAPSPQLDIVPSDGIHSLKANGTIAALNEALTGATYTSTRDDVAPWRQKRSSPYEACEVCVELIPHDATTRGFRTTEQFFVDVLAVNDPPSIIVPGVVHRALQAKDGYTVDRIDKLTVEEDVSLSIDMTISDVDIDPHNSADVSLFKVELKSAHGSMKLSGTVGLYFIDGADSSGAMKFRGTLPSINKALRGLQYTGATNYHGNTTLTIQVWDEGNIGRGGELSETLTLPIEVLPVDDPPAFSLPPNYIVCGEEIICTIPGVQVKDTDAASDSFVRVEVTVEFGRLDWMRTGLPSSVSVETPEKSLIINGTFVDANKMLASLSYHGRAGTHSRVDRIGLLFFETVVNVEEEQEALVLPAATARINVLLEDTQNNKPKIEYAGDIHRDDASCAVNPGPLGSPPLLPPPSSPVIDEGVCNRLVETKPFICSEDEHCPLSGVGIHDDDSDVLQVSLTVSRGILDIPERSLSGLRLPCAPITSSSYPPYSLILEGSQDSINNALSTLSYRANRHYNDTDSLVINVSDSDGASSSTHSMIIPIETTSVDDLPKLVGPGDVLEVAEDGFAAISIMVADVDSSGPGTLTLEISAKHGAIGFVRSSEEAGALAIQGTAVERDTNTPHKWYSLVEVRGKIEDLNLLAASFVFSPETNFNTEAGGYASIRMDLSGERGGKKLIIDSGEYLVRVNSVNDAPTVSIGPKVPTGDNDTVVSTLEDIYLELLASVADVDDTKLKVELTCTNGSMYIFKRTGTCFACDDVDAVLIDIADGGRQISIQGTIESINSKLGTIRFSPEEDFSGDATVRIVVTDGHGAIDRAEQLIHVITTSDSFQLWMPASSFSGAVPVVEVDEGDRVLIGSAWYERHNTLAMHSLSRETAVEEPQLVYPRRQELETPQAWSLIDKAELSSSFCAELQVSIGSISLDPDVTENNSLEVKASPDNQTVKVVGTVNSLNAAARHLIFSANTEESGPTSLNITVCEGDCGWTNVRPPSRGCVETQIRISVAPQNNPPTIFVSDEKEQPVKVTLNSKEVPIAIIAVDDSDLQDNMILDPHQRESGGFLTVTLEVSVGGISLHTLHGLSFLYGTGVLNRAFAFMGPTREVNQALSTLYFTCFEGIDGCVEGKASVEVMVNDNGFSGTGGPLAASTNIDLLITAE